MPHPRHTFDREAPRHTFNRVGFTLRLYGTICENDFVASIGAWVLENVFVADAY